jgi:hypothetical protein
MNLEEARDLLRRCQQDRQDAREAVAAAQATFESSRLIIQGIIKRFPELADDEQEWGQLWETETERPRGAEAVLSILQVDENKWSSVAGMVNELADRNWLPESENPSNAVRAALERLVAIPDNHVEKGKTETGTVVYRYHEPEPAKGGYGHDEEPF